MNRAPGPAKSVIYVGTAADVLPMAALAAEAGLTLSPAHIGAALTEPCAHVWLVARTAAGEVVGGLFARVLPDELEIDDLVVRPGRRRQGFGRALAVAAVAAAGRRRLPRLVLEVAQSNAAARALYASLGFAGAGRRPAYYGRAHGDAALVLARPTLPAGAAFFVAQVVAHGLAGPDVGWVELAAEGLASGAQAGQFAMLTRPGGGADDAPRPYAYFKTIGTGLVRILVRERPGSTASLLRAPVGATVPGIGPLGRPFSPAPPHLWAVAGGVGAAAFGDLRPHPRASAPLRLFLGLRTGEEKALAAALDQAWAAHGGELAIWCEDGTVGQQGSVVDGLAAALADVAQGRRAPPDGIYACGPDGMLQAVASLARCAGVPCEVSVGQPMACGIGACGSCGHADRSGQQLLACVDGPVYPAQRLYPPAAMNIA